VAVAPIPVKEILELSDERAVDVLECVRLRFQRLF
jgi:hypothetical protein